MVRQPDAEETAPRIAARMSQTGTYLPIHMLPLPGAWADQHHGDVGVGYVIVSYPAPDFVKGQIAVNNVARVDRPVDYVTPQHSDESFLVCHV